LTGLAGFRDAMVTFLVVCLLVVLGVASMVAKSC
jgi:hypothetical protein